MPVRQRQEVQEVPRDVITSFRDTLVYVNGNKNVTFSLPEPLLHEFKIYAAKRNQSMTSLVTEAIEKLVKQRDQEYEERMNRAIDRMRNAPDLGTGGKITWTRDEIHER